MIVYFLLGSKGHLMVLMNDDNVFFFSWNVVAGPSSPINLCMLSLGRILRKTRDQLMCIIIICCYL